MDVTNELKSRMANVTAERSRRHKEALRLYRPMPKQAAFHASLSSERIVRGGNRSGKSMSAFAETASAATGISIIGPNGAPLPFKYPTKRPLLIWVIGYDQRHVGGTIHRMLFTPGAFRIIKDLETEEMRAWRPWEEEDADRIDECEEAPPLIPARLINPNGWAWENKAERVFTVCRLRNGTEIHAFSSKAEPKQGDPVDLVHIDEDIEYSRHVAEWQARLSDRKGRMIWSVWPHSKNDALIQMSERATEQKHREKPDVHEIVLTFSENPFIDSDEKRKRVEAWAKKGPEEVRARDRGEFVLDTMLVYPNFNIEDHGTPRREKSEDDLIDTILRQRNGEPPDDWTRYLVLDPGHSVCAVLFAAVPPPSSMYPDDTVVIYDELYLRQQDADQVAVAVESKAKGRVFDTFLIDNRAGRQTPMGFNKTVKQQYASAFAKKRLQSRNTGANFMAGSDNVSAGIGLVREFLHISAGRRPRLRLVRNKTPWMQREFVLYRKKMNRDDILDEPVSKNDHLMDCLRYLAGYNPQYHKPEALPNQWSAAYKAFKEWNKSNSDARNSEYVHLGPGKH